MMKVSDQLQQGNTGRASDSLALYYLPSLALAAALLGTNGCSKIENANPHIPATSELTPEASPTNASSILEVSSEGKDSVGKLDWNTVQRSNPGYYLDLNEDGVKDFATLRDNTLFFRKGLGNEQYGAELPIAKIKGNVVAYSIGVFGNANQLGLLFFDQSENGYIQYAIGADAQGVPYFGDVESYTFKP